MNRGTKWMLIVAGAACVWMASATMNLAGQQPPTGGTSVAVVNLVEIFNQFEQTKAVNEQVGRHRTQLGADAKAKQAKITGLREARDARNPNTKEWFAADKEFKKAQFEFGVWESIEKQSTIDAHQWWIKKTYNDITDEVGRVAKAKGYHVVLTEENLDDNSDDTTVLLRQIFNRKVIYSDSAIDLTDQVLANLNNAFKQAGGAATVKFIQQ